MLPANICSALPFRNCRWIDPGQGAAGRCAAPAVTLFQGFLNIVDCAYLIYLSRPYLKRADVIDPGSQKGGMVSDVRTNMSTYLPFGRVDIVARYVELKIIRETGEDLMSSEPMSILHYAPGQYYRPHVDYFDPKLTVSKGMMDDGGQRTASAWLDPDGPRMSYYSASTHRAELQSRCHSRL